ncbi:MAG TPA: phosphodiester glycosidase family protein [Thermoanaerobaculia bacterium]
MKSFALGLAVVILPCCSMAQQTPTSSPLSGVSAICRGKAINPWNGSWAPAWTPVFVGVDWTSACTGLAANPGTGSARVQPMNALRVDLHAAGIEFVATSEEGKGQTVSDFLCTKKAQVAINGNLAVYNREKTKLILMGLAKSEGKMVSDLEHVPDATWVGAMALLITRNNHARFAEATGTTIPTIYEDAWTAVAGSPQPIDAVVGHLQERPVQGPLMLLTGGHNNATPCANDCPPEIVAARTSVGLSEDHRYLYLMTIDGSDNGDCRGQQCGASFYDEAAWMKLLGANEALNLDGGGSTTMAVSDDRPDGKIVKLVNNPSDDHSTSCLQRRVASSFGLKARPLPSGGGVPLPGGGCTPIPCGFTESHCKDGSGIPCRHDG